ncbi:S41 family peptidase [Streptomyces sp. NPDC048192]|uniref:S41 family peptidase n=1 Tax=Streptomyces sp. NPDC048192 TaxID=3365510 RepID=UPI00371473DC
MTTPTASPAPVTDVPAVIEETARLVTDHYVFPEVGERLAARLRGRLAQGAYDTADPAELGARVTADLQSENGDRHLNLKFHPEPLEEGEGLADQAQLRRRFTASLGGVPRVQLLDGGAAVLELAPLLFRLDWSAEPLSAAFTLATRACTLILDLRGTVGGDPDAVAFACSYLLDERTHLNTQYFRDGDRYEQSWTLPHVPGARFGGDKPVYVLTSGRTFSAGEELAYDLQQLGRAVIVGETTRGGAHPRDGWAVHPHLEATVPVGRSINPVTGTNWEGTGVRPDVPCPADTALDRALQLAADASTPQA